MKKILTALVCIIMVQLVQAQVQKGSLFLGGSLSVGSNKYESTSTINKNSSWSINPQIGKAIDLNKIIGLQIYVGGTAEESSTGGMALNKNVSTAYGLGVFYRQYFPLAARWSMFGNAGIDGRYGTGETKSNSIKSGENNGWVFSAAITPGISYKAGKSIWLEAALNNLFLINYSSDKQNSIDQNGQTFSTIKRNSFNTGVNLSGFNSIAVGLRWIIQK
jgi:hypothetical protein